MMQHINAAPAEKVLWTKTYTLDIFQNIVQESYFLVEHAKKVFNTKTV